MKFKSLRPSLLTRNIAWMVWSGSISIANSVIVWMIIARSREAADLGRFTVVMSLYLLFFTICPLGLNSFLTAEIARRNQTQNNSLDKPDTSSFIVSSLATLLIWSIGLSLAMCLSGLIVSQVQEVRMAIYAMSLTMPLTAAMTIAESVLTATGRNHVIAVASTTENILRTILPIYLILKGSSLISICVSFVIAKFFALLVYAIIASPYFQALKEIRLDEVKQIIRAIPTFAGITILSAVHAQCAVLMLGRMGTEHDAAIYGIASRFLIPIAILMSSYAGVLQPEAARRATRSHQDLGDFLSRNLRLAIACAVLVASFTSALSQPILKILFGARYSDGALTLSLLMLSIVPFCAVMILVRGLIATQNQRIDLIGNFMAVLTCLISGALLIPNYGSSGAATAYLLSMIVLCAIELIFIWQSLFRLEFWPSTKRSEG